MVVTLSLKGKVCQGLQCVFCPLLQIRDGEPLGGHTNASNDFDAVDDGDEDFLN